MTIAAILTLLVYILVIFLVLGLVLYLLQQFPLTPELHRLANIAVYVIAVVVIILLLLSLVRGGVPSLAMLERLIA